MSHPSCRIVPLTGLAAGGAAAAAGLRSEPWTEPYTGSPVTGRGVVAGWLARPSAPLNDAGPLGLHLKLAGASIVSNGPFGACLQPTDAPQDPDHPRCARAPNHPALSPPDAFTLDAWIGPGAAWPSTGGLRLRLDIALNDTAGVWAVLTRELASNRPAAFWFRVDP